MRILVVQDADWIKKGPHQQHHLMDRLSVRGHEITVIGYDQLWRTEKEGFFLKHRVSRNVNITHKNANITYIRPGFIKFPVLDYISFLFSSRREIKESIDTLKPDVVIGFTSVLSNYWGMKFARENNIPFVYYWTDIIHTLIPFKPFQPIAKVIEKRIIKNSTRVIAINENLKDYVVRFGADSSITQVLPGGVDFDRFNISKIDPHQIQEEYGLSKDDLVLFFMGWIYEFSGLKEIILELSKIKDRYPHIKLMVVGEGEYYLQLKELVKLNGVRDQVIFTGKRPYEEIPQLIAAADICLLPAHNNKIMRDIVPIKMYEYLAMNKPIISTRLPGVMKEFGQNNGVIYVDRPEDVLKKVIELNKGDIQKNGRSAKEFIKKYDWDNIVPEFECILESLI